MFSVLKSLPVSGPWCVARAEREAREHIEKFVSEVVPMLKTLIATRVNKERTAAYSNQDAVARGLALEGIRNFEEFHMGRVDKLDAFSGLVKMSKDPYIANLRSLIIDAFNPLVASIKSADISAAQYTVPEVTLPRGAKAMYPQIGSSAPQPPAQPQPPV